MFNRLYAKEFYAVATDSWLIDCMITSCSVWAIIPANEEALGWLPFHATAKHENTLGGTHLEKGYGDVRPLRPPFHALLSQQFPKTPISACFRPLRPPLHQKSQICTKFAILESKFTKISVPKASNFAQFKFQSLKLGQIQFFKPLFLPKKSVF